jgi:hypothetical protein
MAILQQGKNQVEVRIKREPEGSYFDEFVKLNDREKPDIRMCQHYIVGEPGVTYSIEVTLKAGYDFGNCKKVKVWLYTHGRKEIVAQGTFRRNLAVVTEDVKILLSKTNLLLGGQKLRGASLAFKDLKIGKISLCIDQL